MNTQPSLSATESLGVMLSLVRAELVRSMEEELAASGLDLSYTQFLILKKLARLGPMSASNLARTVELDGGAMTRQLDQLERKDYLRRCPHEQDRRTLRIELTEAGAAKSQQLTDCSARVLEAAQRSLSETERNQLHDYLTRVLHALRDKN
ncbi:MAG TPA: MarR family transcriptional regulator [Rhodanobacter sp.]|nr:MarR family transcriptional regulator [Rhodanobacter sp.]